MLASNYQIRWGPQLSGPFKQWCKENNIKHEVSSPYNPKSNGLAEAAVKNVKNIIAKCYNTKEDVGKFLYVTTLVRDRSSHTEKVLWIYLLLEKRS